MSNRRRRWETTYRTGYLRSRVWFARRDRWFAEQAGRGIPLGCAGCGRPAPREHLELHHHDYAGVVLSRHGWRAEERHDDLEALHPLCHELLHRLIERDLVLARLRDRRTASREALARLHAKLLTVEGAA